MNVALDKDSRDIGVKANSKEHGGELNCLLAKNSGGLGHGESVEINNAMKDIAVVLPRDPVDERAQMVAQVDRTGGLDAGKNTWHAQTLLPEGCVEGVDCLGPGACKYDYQVAIDVATPIYEGPFDLLLHLILREEVDIHEISLSTIVDAYLAELLKMTDLDLEIATEFLLIAATLVELKARRLLPGKESIDLDDELALWEERDLLLARLLECKTFKDVAKILAMFVDDADRVYGRTVGADERFDAVTPDLLEGITVEKLQKGLISAITPKPRLEVNLFHVSPIRFTVAEAVEEMMDELPRMGSTSFRRLTADLVERLEIVVRFLAILELYKQGYIEVDQIDRFGDIVVQWTGIGPGSTERMEIDVYEG